MSIQRIDWAHYFPAASASVVVTANSVTETLSVDLSGSDWWYVGPSSESTGDLIAALDAALTTHSELSIATITVSTSDFRSTIAVNASTVIEWDDASTTLPAEPFGWSSSADTGLATTSIVSPNSVSGVWRPGRPPNEDSRDRVAVIGGARSTLLGESRVSHFGLSKAHRDVAWDILTRDRVLTEYAASQRAYDCFQVAWEESIGRGYPMRLFDSVTDSSPVGTYRVRELGRGYDRSAQWFVRWGVQLRLRRV